VCVCGVCDDDFKNLFVLLQGDRGLSLLVCVSVCVCMCVCVCVRERGEESVFRCACALRRYRALLQGKSLVVSLAEMQGSFNRTTELL